MIWTNNDCLNMHRCGGEEDGVKVKTGKVRELEVFILILPLERSSSHQGR